MIKKLARHIRAAWPTCRPALANSVFTEGFTEHSMRGLILGLAALVVTSPFAQAGDITAGRIVMLNCQSCHGTDGLATVFYAPNLAGQKEDYLLKSLKAYKAGARKVVPLMSQLVKSLSDEDMANVAAYYAAIKITVEVPQ